MAHVDFDQTRVAALVKECRDCADYLRSDKVQKYYSADVIYRAAAKIERLQAQTSTGMEWHDIATAPKGGDRCLVFVPRKGGMPIIVSASNVTGVQWWARGVGDVKPSHWMPIPQAPILTPPHMLDKHR